MKKDQLDLEHAKSWFVLAQLTIILAGFLIAGGSIAMTNAQTNTYSAVNNIYDSVKLVKDFENFTTEQIKEFRDAANNYTNYLKKLSEYNLNYAKASFYMGFSLVYLSLLFFLRGKHILNKIKEDSG